MLSRRAPLLIVILAALGTGACAGSDPNELIPAGLRATLAAEDRNQQPSTAGKAVSVDDMLARARGGKAEPKAGAAAAAAPSDATAATADAAPRGDGRGEGRGDALPPNVTQAVAAMDARASAAPRTTRLDSDTAPPAANGVHPLWARFNSQSAGGAPGGNAAAVSDATLQPPMPVSTRAVPPPKPDTGPINGMSVVLRFPGTTTTLGDDEKARLDAAVTLHRNNSKAARIVAGPASEGAAFERLLTAEKRSQAVDEALPQSLDRTRDYSPQLAPDTVRVEFQPGRP
ncbi:MAG: hypothetical protein LCH95_11815 [Proteobacteria bacterium]|nr:hypothetical protein [Pseudomonadota bacterium]